MILFLRKYCVLWGFLNDLQFLGTASDWLKKSGQQIEWYWFCLRKKRRKRSFSALSELSPWRTEPVYFFACFFAHWGKKERSVCILAKGLRLTLENHFPLANVLKLRSGISREICNLYPHRPLKKIYSVNYQICRCYVGCIKSPSDISFSLIIFRPPPFAKN